MCQPQRDRGTEGQQERLHRGKEEGGLEETVVTASRSQGLSRHDHPRHVISQSSAVVQKGMLGTWRTQCSGPGGEDEEVLNMVSTCYCY